MLTVKEAIQQRRSIRKYKPDPVPDELIDELIEAARLAPSGTNSQPWKFIVMKDPDLKRQVRKAALNQKYVEEAPLVIVCCADANRSRKAARQTNWEDLRKAGAVDDISDELVNQIERGMNPEAPETDPNIWLPSARANVSIAITHMMLMATALGLGTVWLGATGGDVTRKLLSIPDDVYLVALLCVGYPDQSPPQRPRLSRDEILLPEPIPAKAAALA